MCWVTSGVNKVECVALWTQDSELTETREAEGASDDDKRLDGVCVHQSS